MADYAYDLLIIFNRTVNNTTQSIWKVVENVTNHGYFDDSGIFFFRKNGYDAYIPKENVIFIGRDFDWDDKSVRG